MDIAFQKFTFLTNLKIVYLYKSLFKIFVYYYYKYKLARIYMSKCNLIN
jgi:hypothetical protein